jgi:hypothetical protein
MFERIPHVPATFGLHDSFLCIGAVIACCMQCAYAAPLLVE